MKKKSSRVIATLVIFLCMAWLAGCAEVQTNTGSASGSGSSGSSYAPATGSGFVSGSGSANMDALSLSKNKTLGVVDRGDFVKTVSLLNLTGQNITGFVIKHSFEDAFGANMLEKDDVFLLDEVRDVYYDISKALEAQAAKKKEQASGTDYNYSQLQYDVQVTLADGTTYVLHNLPVSDMEQGRILLQNGVLFLEYVDPWTNEEVITRQDEIDLKAKAEQAAAEEASRVAAEQAAQQQAQAEQWAAQQQQEQQQQQYEAPAGNNDENCIGNAGLMY